MTDILSELTRQLEPLEKQSETARVYLSKRETLKELDVNMFLMEYAAAAKELKELEEKNIIAQNQLRIPRVPMTGPRWNMNVWNRSWKI